MIITELNQTEIKVIAGGVIEESVKIVVNVVESLIPAAIQKLKNITTNTNIEVGTVANNFLNTTTGSDSKYEGSDPEYDGAIVRKTCPI